MFLLAIIASATVFTAKAQDDRPITVDQLPAASREFLNTYFKGVEVSYATVDDDGYFGKSYEVNLMGGTQIEFGPDGSWKEVDCRHNAVPAGIIPQKIENYVKQNYSGQIVTKIDKGRRDYEIELGNSLEIKFDHNFNFLGYDH